MMDFKYILCATVLVFTPLARAGCKEDLQQSDEFLSCMTGFMTFMTDVQMTGSDMSDVDAIFKLMCSDEGKKAFGCMIKIVADCPDLMTSDGTSSLGVLNSIPGFDLSTFTQTGGMDGACAMMIGPCSKVKDCFTVPTSGAMAKRDVTMSSNYYLMFQSQAALVCVSQRAQMMCMLNALDQCPESVRDMVEAQFEQAISSSMPVEYGVVSYQDTKSFLQNECGKMTQDFSEDMCIKGVLISQNFTECTSNVSKRYSTDKDCSVYALSKDCLMDNLQPECGSEKTMFFIRNSHLIFPGIPNDCASGQTSGSDVPHITFGTLLFSSLLTMIYFW